MNSGDILGFFNKYHICNDLLGLKCKFTLWIENKYKYKYSKYNYRCTCMRIMMMIMQSLSLPVYKFGSHLKLI